MHMGYGINMIISMIYENLYSDEKVYNCTQMSQNVCVPILHASLDAIESD